MKIPLALLSLSFLLLPAHGTKEPATLWINSKIVKASNPLFTNGIIITIEGKKHELGFREDGVVVWRHSK